ncbi:MAG TPA: hypothetical protein PKI11_12225 [Candidatus Hydrogenedentes bacterium]|nr:hypothetical protein [Candidatus Hydrogenedentota bacterium]HNT86498.1 hypothetical protein [Candidatus Hydrogenedentota bacterium]
MRNIGYCMLVMAGALSGCMTAGGGNRDLDTRGPVRVYSAEDDGSRLARYAPLFVVEHAENAYNRIGAPAARYKADGQEDVYVDASTPTIYVDEQEFETEHGHYTNLIYRVHFEESPFSFGNFNPSAGKNVGLMTVITIDDAGSPLLINTVHTCGCYHAVIPTSYLPQDALPEKWNIDEFANYGERLPGVVRYPEMFDPAVRPVLYLRAKTHRVKNLEAGTLAITSAHGDVVTAPLAPMEALKHLPLGDGEETSFYYEEGDKKGLVKGARKPWETALLGAWVQDSRVGQDREFGSREETGQLFYTTLNPNKKEASDMSDYAGFLALNGWRM